MAEINAGKTEDKRLHEELEDSFPASDPPVVTRRSAPVAPTAASQRGSGEFTLQISLPKQVVVGGLACLAVLALWRAFGR